MLYLINKTPVCSRELGDFPLSAAGDQRELQNPEGSGFEWFGCWARRVEYCGGYERCAQDSPQDCLAELRNIVDCFCSWILTFP